MPSVQVFPFLLIGAVALKRTVWYGIAALNYAKQQPHERDSRALYSDAFAFLIWASLVIVTLIVAFR